MWRVSLKQMFHNSFRISEKQQGIIRSGTFKNVMQSFTLIKNPKKKKKGHKQDILDKSGSSFITV